MSDVLAPWVKEWALRTYEGLNSPGSLAAALLLRNGEYGALSSKRAIPGDYNDAASFFKDYQAAELLRKYQGLPTGINVKAAARQSWLDGERACYHSNERLSPYVWRSPDCDERILSILDEVRKEVIYLIGFRPSLRLEGRFGPGATVSDSARQCTIPDKLSSPVSFTHDSWVYLRSWTETRWARSIREDWGNHDCRLRPARGNVWFSVPKDATIDRSCAKEPSLNGYYQRGLGLQIGRRLKTRGYDMATLPDYHQKLAQAGSVDGSFSTIDLKSASDTICSNLVKLLLPPAWFAELDALRSKFTLFEGKWQRLEKFSSMGNGFTFELETVIFLAASRVATRSSAAGGLVEWVSVYGDDIVVPTEATRCVMSLLSFLGFSPNQRKTFVDGNFRESCGGDFFRGEAVRPYLLKDLVDEPQHFLGVANGVHRMAHILSGLGDRRDSLRRSYFHCLDSCPRSVRQLFGPKGLGDLVLTDDDERRWITRERHGIRYIRVFRPVARNTVRWDGFGSGAQMAAALYLAGGAETQLLDFRGRLSQRGDVSGYKIGWVPYS